MRARPRIRDTGSLCHLSQNRCVPGMEEHQSAGQTSLPAIFASFDRINDGQRSPTHSPVE